MQVMINSSGGRALGQVSGKSMGLKFCIFYNLYFYCDLVCQLFKKHVLNAYLPVSPNTLNSSF